MGELMQSLPWGAACSFRTRRRLCSNWLLRQSTHIRLLLFRLYHHWNNFLKTIQVPDFDIKNQVDGFQATPDFKATIHSDGTVHWAIAGGMKVFCAFTGLASIPFDTLGCQLLFGAHTRGYSKQLNYKLLIPEYISVGAFELSYNEWTLDPYETEQGYAFDENAIYYNVYFKRAKSYYVQNIVVRTHCCLL
jgi:hypothetical protein